MDQKSNKNKPNKSTVENKPEPKYHHQIQEHTNQDQTPKKKTQLKERDGEGGNRRRWL